MRRFLRNNGLSIVLLGLFIGTVLGQLISGWHSFNQDQADHGRPPLAFGQYLVRGHCLEALAENWESEFLQMAMFVILTAFLYQKGSGEAKDPDKPDESEQQAAARSLDDAPWPVRRGGWVLRLYSHSLSLTFIGLFLLSFYLHALGGAHEYNREQVEHGEAATSSLRYMSTAQFWFESFQNWQSEFLSLLAMVVLTIFLREKGSQESKPVALPHHENEL